MAAAHSDLDIAPFIDHALLDVTATPEQVARCCDEADRFQFASVCVYPIHVQQAVEYLHNKNPKVCSVIGFPTGATTAAVKLYEAQEAADHGATELDVVMNIGWLKTGQSQLLHRELADICDATGQTVKAILETHLLTYEEKQLAVDVCLDAGVQFLKTNTGWFGGVTVEDVKFLKAAARDRIGIKASGGIRTFEQAIELILAGATRLGTSRGPALIQQRQDPSAESSASAY
ncbi:MAG: deoxyribose-phosphate aldolase [Synechococcales cyanobacterium K44_A2020_017]|nr:deoxyribose-phosphate aldolase [Synechococcales cyanobacterium K32_A2020_035]MBF2094804.1 deoxyribose-phosphate aldolase [Synechococcales cyanobacterium K44_A2020_017]